MNRLIVKAVMLLGAVPALTGEASAQPVIYNVGGTVASGDGIFLIGAGYYNLNTAMANSINVDTMIRLNEYIYQSIKQENYEKARHRAAVIAENRAKYKQILDRIENRPEELDVEKGSALNRKLEQLLAPDIQPSMFSLSPILLDSAAVRSIPFFYGPEGTIICMNRVTPSGKFWPVGLRGTDFARERDAYDLALESTKDLQTDGKLSRAAIGKLGNAIESLKTKLDLVVKPDRNKDYVEAEQFLKRLAEWKDQLRKQEIEKIVGEIESYSGTTVHEFVLFMQRNNLRFGPTKIGNEREFYPKLYAKLQQQLDTVKNAAPGREEK